jgi:RNA polymerase sigma factor (sigma-70 family)
MAVAHEAGKVVRLEPDAGDHAAHLYRRHAGWIYGYCLRRLRSPEEAEDALQTTYLQAYRSLEQGFEPRSDSAWLFRVAENVCLSRLRSSSRRAQLERLQDVAVLEEAVAAPHRPADELIGLSDALATLTAQQRRAILLREWQGLSYREVAAELGLGQSAVEALIFRARRALAAALERPKAHGPRLLHGLGVPGLLASAKSFFLGGGAAVGVKVAAGVAVVTSATVIAADPVGWHLEASGDAPRAAAGTRAAEVSPAVVPAIAQSDPVSSRPPAERFDHLVHRDASPARPTHASRPERRRELGQVTASEARGPASPSNAQSTPAVEGTALGAENASRAKPPGPAKAPKGQAKAPGTAKKAEKAPPPPPPPPPPPESSSSAQPPPAAATGELPPQAAAGKNKTES